MIASSSLFSATCSRKTPASTNGDGFVDGDGFGDGADATRMRELLMLDGRQPTLQAYSAFRKATMSALSCGVKLNWNPAA